MISNHAESVAASGWCEEPVEFRETGIRKVCRDDSLIESRRLAECIKPGVVVVVLDRRATIAAPSASASQLKS